MPYPQRYAWVMHFDQTGTIVEVRRRRTHPVLFTGTVGNDTDACRCAHIWTRRLCRRRSIRTPDLRPVRPWHLCEQIVYTLKSRMRPVRTRLELHDVLAFGSTASARPLKPKPLSRSHRSLRVPRTGRCKVADRLYPSTCPMVRLG